MSDEYVARYRLGGSIGYVIATVLMAAVCAGAVPGYLAREVRPVGLIAVALLFSLGFLLLAVERAAAVVRRTPCVAVRAAGIVLGRSLIPVPRRARLVPWADVARVRLYDVGLEDERGREPETMVHVELRDGTADRRLVSGTDYDRDAMARACAAFGGQVPVSLEGPYPRKEDPMPPGSLQLAASRLRLGLAGLRRRR